MQLLGPTILGVHATTYPGGLGDVVGLLPAAMAPRGHRVMVVVPRCAHALTRVLG